jgi:integrase
VNVRYFEKRPGAWHLDFRANGERYRPYGGPTEAAARKEAPAIIARVLSAGTAVAPAVAVAPQAGTVAVQGAGGKTLLEAYKLALRVREQWIKSKDKKTLQQTFDAIIEGSKGKLTESSPCAILTRDFVRDLRAVWLQERGKRKGTTLSASTVNHRLSMLSVLLEVCDLPPHTVKHLSTKGNQRERRITDQEVKAMQSWLLAKHERAGALSMVDLITLGLELGARQGELLALQWGDVAQGTVTFRDTKNHMSRTIPLTQATRVVLERRRETHKASPFEDLDQDRVTDLWDQARAGIGLSEDQEFVFHGLRHECLSRLADKGVNSLTLKAIAGHESVTTTERYVKTNLGAMQAAMGLAVPQGATLQ